MACRTEFESEEGCIIYFEGASKLDADEAIDLLHGLYCRYSRVSKKTSARLKKLFDIGFAIYERRFKEVWVPF